MAKAAKITLVPTDAPLFGRTDTERWAVQAGDQCLYVSTNYLDAAKVQWRPAGTSASSSSGSSPAR
ncbi:MAG: hypothetical protein HC884_04555 [Chloroflexaceae bacterium]|nr:hypothetical protein [Chloroflexaceae bacterium]